MRYFLDFEATQFSGRIISIGCVAENGETFYTLCKPSKPGENINTFITELTGITKEMLAEAPSADDAWNMFFDWAMAKGSDGSVPQYYCYGNADAGFIKKTVKYMSDFRAITFANSVMASMIDYAPIVANFFNLQNIGLHRVFKLLTADDENQHHNALEDAQMLMFVKDNLATMASPEDVSKLPPRERPQVSKQRAKCPDIWFEWPDGAKNMYQVNTRGTEDNWTVKAYNKSINKTVYFDTMENASLWVIKYLVRGRSPRKADDRNAIAKRIKGNFENKTAQTYCGFKWEVKNDN